MSSIFFSIGIVWIISACLIVFFAKEVKPSSSSIKDAWLEVMPKLKEIIKGTDIVLVSDENNHSHELVFGGKIVTRVYMERKDDFQLVYKVLTLCGKEYFILEYEMYEVDIMMGVIMVYTKGCTSMVTN
ncbi:MAG: hypothetical protein ACYCZW_03015 [Minisyncoccota bacterium]